VTRLNEKLKEINVWKGENIEPIQITPARKHIIFNQNLLVQLLYFDNAPLFLAIKTADNELDFKSLCSLLESSSYVSDNERIKEIVSSALDTLLDFGIFKAKWDFSPHTKRYERVFVNRNELFDVFSGFQQKLTQKLTSMNFSETASDLRSRIHLGEATDLTFKDGYYQNRKNETEADFIKFIKELVLQPQKYDVLIPLARKSSVIFDHLMKEHKLNVPFVPESGINRLKGSERICLFDDAVKQGRHLYNALRTLVKSGISPQNITLISYLLNRTRYCASDNKIRQGIRRILGENRDIIAFRELNDWEFHRRVSDVIMYIASFGSIIDPDHMVASIELTDPLSGKDVMKILKELGIGKVLEPGANLQYLYSDNKKKIALDQIDYCALTDDVLPEVISEIVQCKIRMIWTYNDKTFLTRHFELTPIVNPAITKRSLSKCKHECSTLFKSTDPTRALVQRDAELCLDCALLHMVPRLFETFLNLLADKMPSSLHIESIKWTELESKYEGQPIIKKWEQFSKRLLTKYTPKQKRPSYVA
jgi:hypothetical protein